MARTHKALDFKINGHSWPQLDSLKLQSDCQYLGIRSSSVTSSDHSVYYLYTEIYSKSGKRRGCKAETLFPNNSYGIKHPARRNAQLGEKAISGRLYIPHQHFQQKVICGYQKGASLSLKYFNNRIFVQQS